MRLKQHLRTLILGISLGMVCRGAQNIVRENEPQFEALERLLEEIRPLSGQNPGPRARSAGSSLAAYLGVAAGLLSVSQPPLRDELPGSVLCILADRSGCGFEAELTRALASGLSGPLRDLVSALRSQTCSGSTITDWYLRSAGGGRGDQTTSLLDVDVVATALAGVPAALFSSWAAVLPPTVSYLAEFLLTLLHTPLEYLHIILQFGVDVPAIDKSNRCQQGDLKQLLMWGMSHNLSWSFGETLLDIFLAPNVPVCSYPGTDCQMTPQFSRSFSPPLKSTGLLRCDMSSLAHFNSTRCAELVREMPANSTAAYSLCRELSVLSREDLQRVWSNACHSFGSLLSPFLNESACSDDTPARAPPAPVRVARSDRSLKDLLCIYDSWVDGSADPSVVSLCSENFQSDFIPKVCENTQLFQTLLKDPKNFWLWAFCFNLSTAFMVDQYCAYDTWRPENLVPSIVTFCWNSDHDRFLHLLCDFNLHFFEVIFSSQQNNWIRPNCSGVQEEFDLSALVADSCRYWEWSNPSEVTADQLSVCIQNDQMSFLVLVCNNGTFLQELLKNPDNAWVSDYCTSSPANQPTENPVNVLDWCTYGNWLASPPDPSIVGLCWQNDQIGFQKYVCCVIPLFEKLTLDPQNEWVKFVCTNDTAAILDNVCLYSDWIRPTIVDMTELALCAELDVKNFTQKVCYNNTVLRNMVANLDNIWLLQYCTNQTGRQMGFDPAVECQYNSWAVELPESTLLALCWDHDQAKFVSSVCTNPSILSLITKEISSLWANKFCAFYTNQNSAQGPSTDIPTVNPRSCPVWDLMQRLNWSCGLDVSVICQPGSSKLQGIQTLLRCGLKVFKPHLEALMTPSMAPVLDQVNTLFIVILVALEESNMTTLRVTENIRLAVVDSLKQYLDRETNFDNKRVLLQCFGGLLTNLMQTRRLQEVVNGTTDSFFFFQEYFKIPLQSLSPLLSGVDNTTIRQILQYYLRNRATLQLSEEYVNTMMSVLFHTQLAKDYTLFPDLIPLLSMANPADIETLPPLQSNVKVLQIISSIIPGLSPERRSAFGKWFGKSISPLNTTAGGLSFIRDTGNLIVYLPFHTFQNLSPAQLEDGLDVLMNAAMSPLQQQFVAQRIVRSFRNLTANQFVILGNTTCFANTRNLLAYVNTVAFPVIQGNVRACVNQGLQIPSEMIGSLVFNTSDLTSPAAIGTGQLSQLAYFLPLLGSDFLSRLNQSQLRPALDSLRSVPFTPAQARAIVDKLFPNASDLSVPAQLQALGTLVCGVKAETLLTLPVTTLLSALPRIGLKDAGLTPLQANTITSKLWASANVTGWLDKVEPLLSATPLLHVMARASRLLGTGATVYTYAWNTQQAMTLFDQFTRQKKSVLSIGSFLSLGTVAPGVSCNALRQMLPDKPPLSTMRSILIFLRNQSVPLHTSLKKCIIEELYRFDFFSELLNELGSQIALSLPVSTIKKFPPDMMDTLRKMILQEPRYFMLLPSIKQELLVDKIVQRLDMATGEFTEDEFRSLGVMATYVADQIFEKVGRSFFMDNLELFKSLCYSSIKQERVAQILLETAMFGSVQNWTTETLIQVDRFLFFLSKDAIQQIPANLMTQERIERLFISQRQWQHGEIGALCVQGRSAAERQSLFEKQQFVLQYFLGFLRVGRFTSLIPSCEALHATQPAAWSIDSLKSMSRAAFSSCLELMGNDPFLMVFQLQTLLQKTKEVYGPASNFFPSVISQLGRMAPQLSTEELVRLQLSERSTIAALGAVSSWNSKQLPLLFLTIMNSTKQSLSQLDSSTLVAFGYIICGIDAKAMRNLSAVEFSKAVLWLGQLRLSCSEEQSQALVWLLSQSEAFGPVSSWSTEVFLEIGTLAVGLSDMEMSSLVKEQIEGITPLAFSLIPPEKFSVVFKPVQISMFSYDQAVAVTNTQSSALSIEQQTALAMVLNPWENKPIDFRGRSSGVAVLPCPLSPATELLMLLLTTLLVHAPVV
ncbi:stereocilin isoform X2 [Denticeps clupeoides]|uniref:stereocilin isoform X2 n=1 Tax=Denticeps clupeoides TaxID=299321 RepID=UPI0010A4CE6D|nr:stereocilin-like isoform X2 [Denticeps clupeoides]